MTIWPATLPTYPLLENYVEMVEDTTIKTEMDSGPAKVRQRTTAAARKIQLNYFLSKEQIEELDNFYLTSLKGGSLTFEFIHPRTSADIICRFINAPQYSAANGNYYKVKLDMEIMP